MTVTTHDHLFNRFTLKGVGSLGGASGCSAGTLCKWDGCTVYSLKRYVRMNIQVRVTTARQDFIEYASTCQRQHNTANMYLWLWMTLHNILSQCTVVYDWTARAANGIRPVGVSFWRSLFKNQAAVRSMPLLELVVRRTGRRIADPLGLFQTSDMKSLNISHCAILCGLEEMSGMAFHTSKKCACP